MAIFTNESLNYTVYNQTRPIQSYTDLIVSLVKTMGYRTYLELGVREAYTLKAVSEYVDFALGVDIVDKRKCTDTNLFLGTTDEFFEALPKKQMFDCIFIDADHKFEQVAKDFHNSITALNKYGIIILHDTDPDEKMYLDPMGCNDAYKVIKYIQSTYGCTLYDIITLPVEHTGLSIVTRKSDRRVFNII